MTADDAVPRRWPPPTAVFAAGLLVLPPAAGCWLTHTRPADLLVPLVWLLIAVGPAYRLLRGRPSGFGGAVGVLLLVAVVFGGSSGLAVLRGVAVQAVVLGLLIVGCWAVTVAGLLAWPETRRWCGRLPPRDPEGDG